MKTTKIALVASVLLALAFLWACKWQDTDRAQGRDDVSYLPATVSPCRNAGDAETARCASRSSFELDGLVPASKSLPERPRTYEELLNGTAPGASDPYDVAGVGLLRVTHIVIRGESKEGTLRCEAYPILFPEWSLSQDSPLVRPEDFAEHGVGPWRHLMCFSDVEVYEYFIGNGPATLTIAHGPLVLPFDSTAATDSDVARVAKEVVELGKKEIEGNEWVFWLSPSHTTASESWVARKYWDVQLNEDNDVVIVSPDFGHYSAQSSYGFKQGFHSLLAPTIADFRDSLERAEGQRRFKTNARVGLNEDTPGLERDANYVSEYFDEFGAYDGPLPTPAPPPPVKP